MQSKGLSRVFSNTTVHKHQFFGAQLSSKRIEQFLLLPLTLYSLVAQMVKSPPAVQETWVLSLDQEDPLEKGRELSPVFLPRKSRGQRSLAVPSLCGHKESDTAEQPTHTQTHTRAHIAL